jgi:Protein of unknown function (DUF1329)
MTTFKNSRSNGTLFFNKRDALNSPEDARSIRFLPSLVWYFCCCVVVSLCSEILLPLTGMSEAATVALSRDQSASLSPGSIVDKGNVQSVEKWLPMSLVFAIKHGMRVRVVDRRSYSWPSAYGLATERYSSQVRLNSSDEIENYTAGLPFSTIEFSDPKAAVKIAYNWRLGPFLPSAVSLESTQKTHAYLIDPTNGALVPDDEQRDFRNENDCDKIAILRNRADNHELTNVRERAKPEVEWQERADECGPDRGASITVQYADPRRADDTWVYIPVIRKWRELAITGGYPHQSCTYSCTQVLWEYLPPKTEAYTFRLIAKQPLLACFDTKHGVIPSTQEPTRFSDQSCQLREAYVLEMTPKRTGSEQILKAKVYIDAETYLYLGGEFFRDQVPDVSLPFWRIDDRGTNVSANLTDDIYIPGRENVVLSLNDDELDTKWNPGIISNGIFNPYDQQFSPR